MKIVFIGTVESSYEALKELIKNNIEIEAVFTQDQNEYNTDFKSLRPLAEENGIEVYGIDSINEKKNIDRLKKINPDIIFVIGISQLIKKEILDIPDYGCIGFHPALLPKDRGRAVIPWTILKEKPKTGVTLFYMTEGMDDGDIIVQEEIEVDARETARTLYDKVIKKLRQVIRNNIEDILNNRIEARSQNEREATYCAKRTPKDGLIDWRESAVEIDKLIRATTHPYPGAFTYHKNKKLIIWSSELIEEDNFTAKPGQRVEIIEGKGVKVKTGKGLVLIKEVEYNGKQMLADELFNVSGNQFESLYDLYFQWQKGDENLRR